MIFRGIDQDTDWLFGKGKQSYFTGAQAIAANIKTRLLSFYGDCFFDVPAGVDWVRLLGTPATQEEIKLSVRANILQAEGVLRINRLDVVLERTTRKVFITYDIDTIYTTSFNQSVEV